SQRSGGRAPEHERPYDARPRRHLAPLDLLDAERRADPCQRVAVRVAAERDGLPEAFVAVLAPGEPCVLRAHVLEEEVAPVRPEHPPDLGERPLLILDGAEDERADDGVEGGVRERERVEAPSPELDSAPDLRRTPARTPKHRVDRARHDELRPARPRGVRA